MRRAWLGLALLSASWLFGLDYYHHAHWLTWAALVAAGTALLVGFDIRRPTRGELLVAVLLTLPAFLLVPWPYRAAILLIFVGAGLSLAPLPGPWSPWLGAGSLAAGMVLLVQSGGILCYASITARSHELPVPVAALLSGVARLLGIDAALNGTTIALHSMRRVHFLGATWELLLDPVTWCFLLGGLALLYLRAPDPQERNRARALRQAFLTLALAIALWLPIRVGLLLAVFMHRVLRTGYDAPLVLMNQFWSPWVHLALLAGPVLLALRFVRLPPRGATGSVPAPGMAWHRGAAPAALVLGGTLLLTFGLLWDPCGPRKQGRILFDEHRSTWERTDRPYDTQWYGQESGYNYACIYDYLSRFYEMGRLTTPIEAKTLDGCSVLVVKTPTARYRPDEITAIEQFVTRGGGLLLVGEHTNVFNTGVYLNDIADRFGFRFRYDCLFDIDTVFRQLYRMPLVRHPILQNMPPLDFAVSCSIAPRASIGRAVIRATGLRSLPADYHASNFYPQVEDRAEARYGAFIQLWTVRQGAGRVAAFTDSTVFSNFSTFEPGKAELMLGMLEWLNHRNDLPDARPLLLGLGLLLAGGSLVVIRRAPGVSWLLLTGAVMFGGSVGIAGVRALQRRATPPPQPMRSFTHVVIDRTVCDAPLSTSGFIAGEPNGFGIFERWVLRLGWFTSRRQGPDVFAGDLLVFLHPNQPVPPDFRTTLRDYVTGGGKVLILDSPLNTQSTANMLLYPFDLSVEHATELKGAMTVPEGWPVVPVDSACEVKGGTPLIRIAGTPVAATVKHGRGTVTVIGFGSRFADRQMGVTGDVIPDAPLRDVFELEFSLLRSLLPGNKPSNSPAPSPR
jgi:hypothetical protein